MLGEIDVERSSRKRGSKNECQLTEEHDGVVLHLLVRLHLSPTAFASLGSPDDEVAVSSRSAKDVQDHILANAILAVDQANVYSQVYRKGGSAAQQT